MPSVDARQILRRWVDGVNNAEISNIVGLYAENCTFLPTFSADVCCARTQIEDYFKKLARRGGVHVALDEDSVVVQALGGAYYVLSGRYVFQLGNDAATVYPARFTLIVDVGQESPILHHHSSRVPEVAD